MKTLILLPGLVCDERVWRDQTQVLRQGFHCLIPDYGRADTLEKMARIVLKMAEEAAGGAQETTFALAGHSMGGRVALEVMRLAPEKVSHLALMDTGVDSLSPGEAGEGEKAKRSRLLDIARDQGMRAMANAWLPDIVHPDLRRDRELSGDIVDMITRRTPDIFAAQMRALLNRPDASGLLALIRCPTAVICGRQDLWSPLPRHERIAARIPDSRLFAIEDAGHMVTMEQPAQALAAMQSWLRM